MLDVETSHFEDGKKSRDGRAEYAGILYRLIFNDLVYVVRRYDESDEAAFLRATNAAGEDVLGPDIPYDDPRFAEAVRYLMETLGVKKPKVLLSGGYAYVDLGRVGGPRS